MTLVAVVAGAAPAWGGPVAYVANHDSADVTVVDSATHEVVDTLEVGPLPSAVLFTPLGRFAYVAVAGPSDDADPDAVAVFVAATGERLDDIEVGDSPVALGAAPDGQLLFVANAGRPSVSDGSVSIVDAKVAFGQTAGVAVLATVPTGGDPGGVAVSPDGRFAYVTNHVPFESNVVFVIDVDAALANPEAGVVDEITVGNSPLGIAVTPNGKRGYVANFAFGSNLVSVLDLESLVALPTVSVGSRPAGVAISPDGAFAWVTNLISESVSVIDTSTNVARATVGVGPAPQGIAFLAGGDFVYVANRQSLAIPTAGTVSVVDVSLAIPSPEEAVIDEIDVGLNPIAVAAAADGIEVLLDGIFTADPPSDGDVNDDLVVNAADLPALIDEQSSS